MTVLLWRELTSSQTHFEKWVTFGGQNHGKQASRRYDSTPNAQICRIVDVSESARGGPLGVSRC